jgi:hypothetical protein
MASNHSGGSKHSGGSERGGWGNFANDPQRASEEGKKGSQRTQHHTKESETGEAGRKGGHHSGSSR